MGKVKPCLKEHIPQVAALQWKYMYRGEVDGSEAVERYVRDLFFESPWYDPALPSLVYEDQRGGIVGFLGVVVRRMALGTQVLRAAFGSGFVVHPEFRTTPAGLELVRSFFAGSQDLSLSDTANRISQSIWAGFGGALVASHGRRWARPIRPSLYGLYAISRRAKQKWPQRFAKAGWPLGRAVDSLYTRVPFRPFRAPEGPAFEDELDTDTLLTFFSDTWQDYPLRPVYDRHSLNWLLDFMTRMKGFGELRAVALRNAKGQAIGWYIYCWRREGIAEAVQVCGKEGEMSAVLDHLFHDAASRGAIGVHGKLEARFADALSRKSCFFFDGRTPLLVHSRNPELVRLFQDGHAFFTRLEGEWCLRFGPGEGGAIATSLDGNSTVSTPPRTGKNAYVPSAPA